MRTLSVARLDTAQEALQQIDDHLGYCPKFITLGIWNRRAPLDLGQLASKVSITVASPLVRTVYRSRSTLHPDNSEELDKIFKTAVRNNRRLKLSGCLAHLDGHFVQVIEGEVKQVDALMGILNADKRHTDVIVLGRWPTSARIFSNWAMARPDIRPLAEQSLRLINQVGSGAQVTAILLALVAEGTLLYPSI